jgi:hypothetical protein
MVVAVFDCQLVARAELRFQMLLGSEGSQLAQHLAGGEREERKELDHDPNSFTERFSLLHAVGGQDHGTMAHRPQNHIPKISSTHRIWSCHEIHRRGGGESRGSGDLSQRRAHQARLLLDRR